MPFSYSRLKNSFVSVFSSWADLLDVGGMIFLLEFFCAFSKLAWGVGFFAALLFL